MNILKRVATMALVVASALAFSGYAEAKSKVPPAPGAGIEAGWVTITVGSDSHSTPVTVGSGPGAIPDGKSFRNIVQQIGDSFKSQGYSGTLHVYFRTESQGYVGRGSYDLQSGRVERADWGE